MEEGGLDLISSLQRPARISEEKKQKHAGSRGPAARGLNVFRVLSQQQAAEQSIRACVVSTN